MLQLDMNKTYNRVLWSFVEKSMCKMRFVPCICKVVVNMGVGALSSLMFNSMVVGNIELNNSIKKGSSLAPLL